MNSERVYRVLGMTCEHCERAVREQVQRIPGVASANADRRVGELVVRGSGFDDAAIDNAVRVAGYESAAAQQSPRASQ